MTYEVYRYIFIVAAILSAVMLIASVLIFILLKIPSVIGDLSGATARKAIDQIREQNEKTGDKGYKSSAYNVQRGKVTDKISNSGNIIQGTNGNVGGMNTTKISTKELTQQAQASETTVLGVDNETTVLGGANETTVLNSANETTVLNNPAQQVIPETSVLTPEMATAQLDTNVTAILQDNQVEIPKTDVIEERDRLFAIEYDITYIHTNEVIA